jgi:hypothetical protein
MGWHSDVVCDNTYAQQITVHLRSIRPHKLAHVTDIFFSFFTAKKTRPGNSDYCDFLFLKLATHTQTHTHTHSSKTTIPDASGQQQTIGHGIKRAG